MFWLGFFYRISLPELQGDFLPGKVTVPIDKSLI